MNKILDMPASRLLRCIQRLARAIDSRGMRGETDGRTYSAIAYQQSKLLSCLEAKLTVSTEDIQRVLERIR